MGLVVLLMGVAVAAGALAQAVDARHRAAAAADLGALAAAADGSGRRAAACAAAARVVRANGAELVHCRSEPGHVHFVTARARSDGLARLLGLSSTVRSARAGPAIAPGGGVPEVTAGG